MSAPDAFVHTYADPAKRAWLFDRFYCPGSRPWLMGAAGGRRHMAPEANRGMVRSADPM